MYIEPSERGRYRVARLTFQSAAHVFRSFNQLPGLDDSGEG